MRDFEPVRVKLQRQFDKGRGLADIVPVRWRVDGQRQAGVTNVAGDFQLFGEAILIISDLVGGGRMTACRLSWI